jgi:flagellar hook-basal body complex protein FliE
MNPLDALSSLTQGLNIPASGVDFKPTGPAPTSLTNPVGEGFQSLLQPAQAGQIQPISVPDISIGSAGGPSTWGHMVQQMVMDVNAKQSTAAAKVSDVLQGGPTPVHDAMVATEEASLSFEFLGEMRNKIVDAYNQVMQMQV